LIGYAELLKIGDREGEEANRSIEAIIAAIDRGSSLTARLLAFSRKSTLSPAATDVSDVVGGLYNMLQRSLGETVELRIESAPDLWPAMIDPHQFENALVNLTINARDAMPQGGTLTIETSNVALDKAYADRHEEVTPGEYVLVAVSDTGTGMPSAVLEQVFDPFFTTKDVGKGSGLGLSMVYGFAKQSGGHVAIYSEVDHGTTVQLYMPRAHESAAESRAEDDAVEIAGGSERILVVEDDPNVRNIPVRIFRAHGYDVVEAVNGADAVEQLEKGQPFDLLFTDVVLPDGMNGVEIAEEARRLQPGIKVLYTTGYAENAVVHSGQLDPGVTLVNKPYRRTELLKTARAVLDGGND
jgi:CheY-like chemotaxis protein